MSEREELAMLVGEYLHDATMLSVGDLLPTYEVADAILAAGWRKLRPMMTAADVQRALEDGA